MSESVITALPPVGMITVRGVLDEIGDAFTNVVGCPIPEQRLSTRSEVCGVLWMSPDELLILTDAASERGLADRLTGALAGQFATVVGIGDARVVFDISGPGADDVITSLAPVDLAALGETEVRRTRLAQIPAAFWREGGGYRLICFRSVAAYAETLLRNAAGIHPVTQRA